MPDRPEGTDRSSDSSPRDPIRVVFVDDEEPVLELAADELERVDAGAFDVRTATDPDEVVELVAAGAVDCVVSDYEMPGTDGLELLHRVRDVEPGLPFLLFTARGSEELASRAVTEGVTDYLQKDFSAGRFELLANRLANAVRHYRATTPGEPAAGLLSDVVDTLSDSVLVATEDGISYVSEVIEDVLGLPRDRLLDEPLAFADRVPPVDRDRVEAWYAELASPGGAPAGGEREIEFRYDHPETGRRWINVSVNPVAGGDDGAARVVGVVADITAKREAVAELRENEAKFRSIAETSNDLIFRIDSDGVVTYASPALRRILGHEPSDAEGDDFIDYIARDDAELAFEKFTETLAGRSQTDIQLDLRHADGHRVPTEVNAVPIRAGDDIVGVQGVARDVSDRRARERELEQYETIVRTVPDGVFVIDAAGRVLNANERAARMVGLEDSRDDLPSEPIPELTDDGIGTDEAVEKYDEAVRELLSSDEDRTMYRLRTTVESEPRGFEIHLALRPTDGEYRGTIGVIRDVTERLAYERELERQNDRLEQFASTISHDLRNPLSVASGHLEEHRKHCDGDHLEPVAAAHDRIDSLIDDILNLARQGQPLDDVHPAAVAPVARRAWRTVDTGEASLSVREGPGSVRADESRLRQLLENLFRNAVEHGGPDTEVTVGPLADRAGFFVSDDGPGIPAEERERVFDQGYSTGDSTGFGLAIVKEIVDAHDWSISVAESDQGGARFEIEVDPSQELGDGVEGVAP